MTRHRSSSFHAHPDDEAILVGGTLAPGGRGRPPRRAGVRDPGDLGEVADGVLGARRGARPTGARWRRGAGRRRAGRGAGGVPPLPWTRAWPGSPPTTDPARYWRRRRRGGEPAGGDPPRGAGRGRHRLRRPRRVRAPRPHPGAPRGSARRRARPDATRLRGDGQSRVLPRPGGPDAGERARRGRRPRPRGDGPRRARGVDHDAHRRRRRVSTASVPPWPRTRARSPATRSS